MFKYTIAVLGLVLSTTALAGEFKIVLEHKYLFQEGTPLIDGKSAYSERTFKSNGSSYKLLMEEKIMTSSGQLISGVSHDGGDYSAEDVRVLGSVYSSCVSIWKGQVETLTLKAGTFQSCKRTYGNLTEWNIEGFPFTVKTILQHADGTSVIYEAIEVKASK